MATRAQLVDAAKDLNTVLDLSPPIDVKAGVDDLKEKIKEAAELLRDSDEIAPATRAAIDAITGKVDSTDGDEASDDDGETKVKAEKPAKVTKTEKPAKVTKVAKEKPAKPVKTDGKKRRYADSDVITLKVSENPKQNGSAAHGRFALYTDGMTCAQFISAGGLRGDLSWDYGHGFIDVTSAA